MPHRAVATCGAGLCLAARGDGVPRARRRVDTASAEATGLALAVHRPGGLVNARAPRVAEASHAARWLLPTRETRRACTRGKCTRPSAPPVHRTNNPVRIARRRQARVLAAPAGRGAPTPPRARATAMMRKSRARGRARSHEMGATPRHASRVAPANDQSNLVIMYSRIKHSIPALQVQPYTVEPLAPNGASLGRYEIPAHACPHVRCEHAVMATSRAGRRTHRSRNSDGRGGLRQRAAAPPPRAAHWVRPPSGKQTTAIAHTVSERPRLRHARRRNQAIADRRRRVGQPPARRQ